MRLIEDHILRKVHGNVVLVPLSDRETDFNGMIALNHTGEFVCRMLQQDTDRDSLIAGLTQEYGMKLEQVVSRVTIYEMSCTRELEAAQLSYRVMKGK